MQIWKKMAVVALFFLFVVAIPTSTGAHEMKDVRSYVSHGVIVINGPSDFTAANGVVSGSGTQNDPYIIKNYEIDAQGGGRAIYIGNSTKWVKIQNVHVFNASYSSYPYFPGAGIALFNAENVIVEYSNITSNDRGVFIDNGKWNVVRYNNITNSNNYGVDLHSLSSSNTIWKNNMSYNKGGVFLYSSSNNDIKYNDFYRNGANHAIYVFYNSYVNRIEYNNIMYTNEAGIYVSGGSGTNPEGTKITHNVIYNNTEGIKIYSVNNTNVNNNTIYNNTNYGVHTYNSASNVTIEYNHIFTNLKSAIYSDPYSSSNTVKYITVRYNNISSNGNGISFSRYTINSVIHNNIIYNNSGYGVSLSSSTVQHIRVYNNSFYFNNGATNTYDASHVQATDSGTNNYWNETDRGNYWYDWTSPDADNNGIVDNPYSIDGSANNADNYPLTDSYAVPELSSMWIAVLLVLVGGVLYGRKLN